MSQNVFSTIIYIPYTRGWCRKEGEQGLFYVLNSETMSIGFVPYVAYWIYQLIVQSGTESMSMTVLKRFHNNASSF